MARKKSAGPRKKPIRIKKANQGKLRKATGTKKGATIPVKELHRRKRSKNPLTRKRATFALNARRWNKGGKTKGS